MISVGVDVAEARKGLDVVALDGDRRIVHARRRATADDVRTIVADLAADVVCIDSPPGWATAGRSRAAERGLARLGITAFATPTDPGDHPFYAWMRAGHAVFAAVAATHPRHRHGQVVGCAVEVFPHATAVVLAGRLAEADETKGEFRRRVLTDAGVDVASLRAIDAVDAALAALTGVIAATGTFTAVGEPDEGVIVVPAAGVSTPFVRVGTPPPAPLPAPTTPAATAVVPPSPTVRPGPPASPLCGCGCGFPVTRRFRPGHDAKLKSALRARRHAGDAEAAEALTMLGWD